METVVNPEEKPEAKTEDKSGWLAELKRELAEVSEGGEESKWRKSILERMEKLERSQVPPEKKEEKKSEPVSIPLPAEGAKPKTKSNFWKWL